MENVRLQPRPELVGQHLPVVCRCPVFTSAFERCYLMMLTKAS